MEVISLATMVYGGFKQSAEGKEMDMRKYPGKGVGRGEYNSNKMTTLRATG